MIVKFEAFPGFDNDGEPVVAGILNIESSTATTTEWDLFATQCGASYRCGYRFTIWSSLGKYIRRLDIFAMIGNTRRKIGQCAVSIGWSARVFLDQIQLIHDAADRWREAMQAVLSVLGPGRYRYGSEWSPEPPRDEAAASLSGVAVGHVRRSYLEAVEFEQWRDWDAYWLAVSSNVRRNYQKASNIEGRKLNLAEHRLKNVLPNLLPALAIRRDTLDRKAVAGSSFRRSLRSLIRTLSLLDHASMLTCRSETSLVAFASCIEFGSATFYLEGGAWPNVKGVGWLVLVSAIRRAFERSSGRGMFVMGPVDDETIGKPEWKGLALSRRQCLVTQRPVATFDFTYVEGR